MNNLNILFTLYFVFWLQFAKKSESASYQRTDNTCFNHAGVQKLEKCKVCTQKQVGENSISDRYCYVEGVYHRFFLCSNEENGEDVSCNLENSSTVYENHVSVHVPALQNNQPWSCYFDLINGGKGYEHRARLYLNQTHGCSNSSTFAIDKLPGQENKFQYRIKVHSGDIRGKTTVSNSLYAWSI